MDTFMGRDSFKKLSNYNIIKKWLKTSNVS